MQDYQPHVDVYLDKWTFIRVGKERTKHGLFAVRVLSLRTVFHSFLCMKLLRYTLVVTKSPSGQCFANVDVIGSSPAHVDDLCAFQGLSRLWTDILGVEKISSYQSKV